VPDSAPIQIHSALADRGGAARIAQDIYSGLEQQDFFDRVYRTWEIDEQINDNKGRITAEQVGADLFPKGIIHLHSTQNWLSVLQAKGVQENELLVSLHDCSLLTGGCPFPLDCNAWQNVCPQSCPRLFPAPGAYCSALRNCLTTLSPLLVSPSKWISEMARKVFPHIKQVIIPNGVFWPDSLPSREEARRFFGISAQAKVVLFVAHGGSSAQYKAGRHWERLFKSIKTREPGTVGMLIGGQETSRQGDLLILPYMQASRLQTAMRAADVLAYPSLADNHPLVVLEAMSRKLPVVSFAVGGIPEQIIDQNNGFLVPLKDWKQFTEKVLSLLRRPALRKEIAERAFDYGRKRFSLQRMLSDYIKVYTRLGSKVNAADNQQWW
jgi:glycosyltransferase involved in cell wall biosynthesis